MKRISYIFTDKIQVSIETRMHYEEYYSQCILNYNCVKL